MKTLCACGFNYVVYTFKETLTWNQYVARAWMTQKNMNPKGLQNSDHQVEKT